MIPHAQRQQLVTWIDEAVSAGARKRKACKEAGISLRTLQRWTSGHGVKADQRPVVERPVPGNRLSEEERKVILETCNAPEHADLPPSQIVPRLADEGIYLASESSFYRVPREADQCIIVAGRKRRRLARDRPPISRMLPTWSGLGISAICRPGCVGSSSTCI